MRMEIKKIIICSAMLAPLFVASPSAAEDGLVGSVTAGGAAVNIDNESYKSGEYTGIKKNRAYFVGDADLKYKKNANYLDLKVKDLGFDNRSFYLEGGSYGDYKLYLSYNRIPHLISNNAKTPFNGTGTNAFSLPAGFVTGATTPAMTNLSMNLKNIKLETMRKSMKMGFWKGYRGMIDARFAFERETKEGVKSIGGTAGTSGGNARSTVLPEPVNYTTDTLRASISYKGDAANAQASYFLSSFTNANNSLVWENPFTGVNFPVTARISLPPNNWHQRVALSGSLALPLYTRVSAIAEYGIMRQNETLMPYSINPASVVTVPVPRERAGAEIDTSHLTINVTSRPLPKLGLSVKYRYYKADNKTQVDLFRYVRNDSGGAQAAINSSTALYNHPYGYAQNQLKLDASYYLFTATTVKAGYEDEAVDRGYREVAKTGEKTYRAGMQSQYLSFASFTLNGSFAKRTPKGTYDQLGPYTEAHTEQYIATVAPGSRFENLPDLRKFDLAERIRTKYTAGVTFFPPRQKATVGVYYNYWNDVYGASELGLKHSKMRSVTLDAAYSPAREMSLYAFYTQEESRSQQEGRQFGGTSLPFDSRRDWWANHIDSTDTIGAGASLGMLENKLTVAADYIFSQSSSAIKFNANTSLAPPKDMPDLTTRRHTARLSGKYRLMKNVKVGAGYTYERYEAFDWATDNFPPASTLLANVLTLTGSQQNYESHLGMVYLTYYLLGEAGRL